VEAVAAEALFRAERETREAPDREHVCPYLYGHPGQFLLHRPLAPRKWQGPLLRLTVDTPADYGAAQVLYGALSQDSAGEGRYRGETIIETLVRSGAPGRKLP
jgi:spore coat polysaccharide biosynthesis protein SpsF